MTDDTNAMTGKKDENGIKKLMAQKLELVAQIADMKSQIAKINVDLQRMGASSSDLECW